MSHTARATARRKHGSGRSFLSPFVDKRSKSCGEAAQEIAVFGAVRIGLPAEDALFFAVDFGDYLRRVLGSPLGEQVRHLKIFYAAAFAHIYPSVKPVKTEFVAVLCLFNIDELNRRALPADLGVERRGKERSENEIDAVSCGIFT